MTKTNFLDLHSGRLPALERTLIKLRASQVLLAIYYSEELQSRMVDLICTSEKLRRVTKPRLTPETKKARQKALKFLVEDGALTFDESKEIQELINFRNDAAHEIHWLFGDLSTNKFSRNRSDFLKKNFRYDAVDRFQHFLRQLDKAQTKFSYALTLRYHTGAFDGAEKTLLEEIERLENKAIRLWAVRANYIKILNSEIDPNNTDFKEFGTRIDHPENKTRDGRLTPKGVEVCHFLFESGRSTHAVAYLMRMSLASVRRRHRQWRRP